MKKSEVAKMLVRDGLGITSEEDVAEFLGIELPEDWLAPVAQELAKLLRQPGTKKRLTDYRARVAKEKPKKYVTPEDTMVARVSQLTLHLVEKTRRDPVARAEQQRQMKHFGRLKDIQKIRALDPVAFEYWTGAYFERHGFRDAVVTQASGDAGVDVHVICPDGKKAVIQSKHYKGGVGGPVVQQTFGAMYQFKCRRCYIVTTGHFTKAAFTAAHQLPEVYLLDGDFLAANMPPPCRRPR
jgi:restriction endonuclease Mrr